LREAIDWTKRRHVETHASAPLGHSIGIVLLKQQLRLFIQLSLVGEDSMRPTYHNDQTRIALSASSLLGDRATVAVVIPTYNYAHFLSEAIESVLAQTRPADEIIVIDDGSDDDPATVVAQFPTLRLIRTENHGQAAARNTGLQSCNTSHVVFLDADDRLLPTALQTGLNCIADHPDCAFVYGGYRLISENGHVVGSDFFCPIDGDAHLFLLRRNPLGPPATGLYRCDCLLAIKGFNDTLTPAEDYDLHLRVAQKYRIASHPEIVAEYRRHNQNATNNHLRQLNAVLRVLDLHQTRIPDDEPTRAALRYGRATRRDYYVSQMLAAAFASWRARHNIAILTRNLIRAARWAPVFTLRTLLGSLRRRVGKALGRLSHQK
jgi:glycosyltransferase involved in cell wall biosynthesis